MADVPNVGGPNAGYLAYEASQAREAHEATDLIRDNSSFGHVDVNKLAQQTASAGRGLQQALAQELPPAEREQYLHALHTAQGSGAQQAHEAQNLIRDNTSHGHADVNKLAQQTAGASHGLQQAVAQQLPPGERQQYLQALKGDQAQHAQEAHQAHDLIRDNTSHGHVDVNKLAQQTAGAGHGLQQAVAQQLPPGERQQYLRAVQSDEHQHARDTREAHDVIRDNSSHGRVDVNRLAQQTAGAGRGVQQAVAQELPPHERDQYLQALQSDQDRRYA
jgi:hypothetical protein